MVFALLSMSGLQQGYVVADDISARMLKHDCFLASAAPIA